MKLIVSLLSWIIITFNRSASKISVGPIYFTDITMLFGILLNPRQVFYLIIKNWPILFFIIIGLSWLVIDLSTGNGDGFEIRRFAFSFYMLLPIIFLANSKIIYNITLNKILISATLILLLYCISFNNFIPTISCQILSVFIMVILLYTNKYDYKLLYLLFVFIFICFGLLGQGLYKTPLLGITLASLALFILNSYRFIFKHGEIKKIYIVCFQWIIAFLALFLAVTDLGGEIIAEALYAISGLINSSYFSELASYFSDAQLRERGSSQDTAQTRVFFWMGILDHSKNEVIIFLFGNGHGSSFLDLIFPYYIFNDTHLVEPHNSFIGAFFRYGVIGLILLFLSMYISRKVAYEIYKIKPSIEKNIVFSIIAINYAMFEVALESPHGAFIFWFIWLLPYLLNENSLITNQGTEHENTHSAQ